MSTLEAQHRRAPVPADEIARLAALRRYDILDTPSEAEFDDFTRLAAQICGTPVAQITLVDSDRQWFKSNFGVDVPQIPRDYGQTSCESANRVQAPTVPFTLRRHALTCIDFGSREP